MADIPVCYVPTFLSEALSRSGPRFNLLKYGDFLKPDDVSICHPAVSARQNRLTTGM
jgi:hypothetical protein